VENAFLVFIRCHSVFIENFSLGLRYRTGDPTLGTITLVRYNGPHGERSRTPDGHYAVPHIHRLTAAELATATAEPRENQRELTDRYATFDEALVAFFADLAVVNRHEYFPELQQRQIHFR